MYNVKHNHLSVGLIAGCVAALATPAFAGATEVPPIEEPSAGVQVNVGRIGTSVESEQVRSEANAQVDTTMEAARRALAYANLKLQETNSRLQRIRRQLNTTLSVTKAKADDEVAAKRSLALRTASRLSIRVKRLRLEVMRASITLARSTTNGAWIVVSRSGNVLNQSGGASVTRNGRGRYTVQFTTNREGCANVASSNPAPHGGSSVRVSSLGGGAFDVRMTNARGPRSGGFFLALSC